MSHMHSVTSNLALTIKFQVFLMFNDVNLKLKGFKMFFYVEVYLSKIITTSMTLLPITRLRS